mmetsp:Transcript_17004/g.40444  ORF Transcript_17004/g.40444 Transcript_17004/m.40444 type:complete len:419 (+) Transcript_17004:659-1915(+)
MASRQTTRSSLSRSTQRSGLSAMRSGAHMWRPRPRRACSTRRRSHPPAATAGGMSGQGMQATLHRCLHRTRERKCPLPRRHGRIRLGHPPRGALRRRQLRGATGARARGPARRLGRRGGRRSRARAQLRLRRGGDGVRRSRSRCRLSQADQGRRTSKQQDAARDHQRGRDRDAGGRGPPGSPRSKRRRRLLLRDAGARGRGSGVRDLPTRRAGDRGVAMSSLNLLLLRARARPVLPAVRVPDLQGAANAADVQAVCGRCRQHRACSVLDDAGGSGAERGSQVRPGAQVGARCAASTACARCQRVGTRQPRARSLTRPRASRACVTLTRRRPRKLRWLPCRAAQARGIPCRHQPLSRSWPTWPRGSRPCTPPSSAAARPQRPARRRAQKGRRRSSHPSAPSASFGTKSPSCMPTLLIVA